MNLTRLKFIFSGMVLLAALATSAYVPQAGSAGGSFKPSDQAPPEPGDPLVFSYSAKFVCTAALQSNIYWYGPAAPIVQQETDVLVHNPNDFSLTFYRKAVRASNSAPPAPGNWNATILAPDRSLLLDCDDITRLLTGNPSATFVGTYGIGVTVEGFVVIVVGPQNVPGRGDIPYAYLDVQADYVRSSEVLKKDIEYQPWWWWWWWGLPWRLGYAYNRILPASTATNIDCRGALYDALATDAQVQIADVQQRNQTMAALNVGRSLDPTHLPERSNDAQAALVALIGGCEKLPSAQDGTVMLDISYVLVSNKGPNQPNPITGAVDIPVAAAHPWHPGRWYDLPVVIPQNISTDLEDYFHKWQVQHWIDSGGSPASVNAAMLYFFPYWCGWGRWWWWWNGGDCVDIGVGEGESLDVEQITPLRIFMATWPPANP
jgi:hypothetical protein